MAIGQADLDASTRLLRRMFVGQDPTLSVLVFDSVMHPQPAYFRQPNHPYALALVAKIQHVHLNTTAQTVVIDWQLSPQQVDQLSMIDPRILALRQRLANEISLIPEVQDLRAGRVEALALVR